MTLLIDRMRDPDIDHLIVVGVLVLLLVFLLWDMVMTRLEVNPGLFSMKYMGPSFIERQQQQSPYNTHAYIHAHAHAHTHAHTQRDDLFLQVHPEVIAFAPLRIRERFVP